MSLLAVLFYLNHKVSVWLFCFRGPTEPVHCLDSYSSELISGTTANRIGVHSGIDASASFSSTRLRTETFKGVLTALNVLPLNRLLLLGADTGGITLLCWSTVGWIFTIKCTGWPQVGSSVLGQGNLLMEKPYWIGIDFFLEFWI